MKTWAKRCNGTWQVGTAVPVCLSGYVSSFFRSLLSIDIQRLSSSKIGNDLVAEPLLYFAFFPLSLKMRY
ncbi:hypothetical protein NXV95_18750 [Bacteroides fragilis]|nr:hypothetical protein [Bacteroides fragilis]